MARVDTVALPGLAVPMLGGDDQPWQGLMLWLFLGWEVPCWVEMIIHGSERAVCATESGDH